MNKIILIGNLTKDPEVRSTTTGKKVASFSIAINDGKDQNGQDVVQYFNITAWEKKAEIAELYLKKGHKVAITGKLQIKTWEKTDGTKASTPEIVCLELELLTSRSEADRISSYSAGTSPTPQSGGNNSNSGNSPKPKQNDSDVPAIDVSNMDFNVQMPF